MFISDTFALCDSSVSPAIMSPGVDNIRARALLGQLGSAVNKSMRRQ